ncbi:MAG: glycosyltransferase family 4 protein, partial [Promethearchaeota archaeon]
MIDTFDTDYSRDQISIVNGLLQRGHDITVLTSIYNDDGVICKGEQLERLTRQPRIFRAPGVNIKIPGFKRLNIFLPNKAVVGDQYDVIHAYTFYTFSSVISPIIKLLTRSGKLVMRAEIGPENYGATPNLAFTRAKRNRVYRRCLKLIDTYVEAFYTFTERESEDLCKLDINKEKIWVVPIPVEPRFFNIGERLSSSKITIGFLGRIIPGKGIHRIVKSLHMILKENQNVEVIFAGPKSDPQYSENVIRRLSNHKNFKYVGFLPNVDFFPLVDIVLVPSLYETGAKTVLESMAAGRLVIASDAYVMNEYIDHGATGLLFRDENDFFKL